MLLKPTNNSDPPSAGQIYIHSLVNALQWRPCWIYSPAPWLLLNNWRQVLMEDITYSMYS